MQTPLEAITKVNIEIINRKLDLLRGYISEKRNTYFINKAQQNPLVSFEFHLQMECASIDRIIKNAKEFEKCNYLPEIEKGKHRLLCKVLNQMLFDYENELISLGTKKDIYFEFEAGFDFDDNLNNKPIKQLLPNYLKIEKEFEEFIKIDKVQEKEKYLFEGQSEESNRLFNYLVKKYRPNDKTRVKFINILYYMKNSKDMGKHKLKVTQKKYTPIIKKEFGIEIKKHEKSDFYLDDEEPILKQLKTDFLKDQH